MKQKSSKWGETFFKWPCVDNLCLLAFFKMGFGCYSLDNFWIAIWVILMHVLNSFNRYKSLLWGGSWTSCWRQALNSNHSVSKMALFLLAIVCEFSNARLHNILHEILVWILLHGLLNMTCYASIITWFIAMLNISTSIKCMRC